jgi:DNA-binding transcriptional regulator YiaG
MTHIHPQARTTPRVRAEIQASGQSTAELARRYNISEPTVLKWKAPQRRAVGANVAQLRQDL